MRYLTLGEVVDMHRRLLDAPVDDQERLMLDLLAGRIGRSHLIDWLRDVRRLLSAHHSGRAVMSRDSMKSQMGGCAQTLDVVF